MKSGSVEKEWQTEPELLERAMRCWDRLNDYRRERERNKRFTYGDQWSDTIEVDGIRIREEDYIRSQGNVPLKNNMIRRIVRNVLGVFRSRYKEPQCEAPDIREESDLRGLQRALHNNMERNRLEEVYARTMEEFLIGGLVVHRKRFGHRGQYVDCWTDMVLPDNFFYDTEARDFRNWDVSLVGEIHNLDISRICASFARCEEDCRRLKSLYGAPQGRDCRVIEIWHKEYEGYYVCHDLVSGRFYERSSDEVRMLAGSPLNRREERRWCVREMWQCHFLAPGGEVLLDGVSPYRHGGHPFVFKAYPFVDGEIHSFVSDIVDQQKFTNRLISMYDWILRASAKGVLLFPEGALPEGADINDIAEEWSRFNGVILFRPKTGQPLPQQVSSNCANIGITELLDIQLKMMEDISGVNGALQGRLENSSMSGTLYNQQTQNSLISLSDLLKSFDEFIKEATEMDVSNIRQFQAKAKYEVRSER
ncbi:MAG: hypothetical protein K2K97_12250 [Muribaculaceae bacterium]|nr:hypothetical protein [Muribaculaceae bacterium]